jgi:hypothetical protein
VHPQAVLENYPQGVGCSSSLPQCAWVRPRWALEARYPHQIDVGEIKSTLASASARFMSDLYDVVLVAGCRLFTANDAESTGISRLSAEF